MEPAEQIQEAAGTRDDRFKNVAALTIAVLALLLAVTTLGGGNVAEDMIGSNILASDSWAFFQAKNVRQTTYELAADALEAELALHPGSPDSSARKAIEEKIAKYRATIARYDSEPDPEHPNDILKGEGKRELMARAKDFEKQRARAQKQDPNFDYAEALYQIAIVLASVSILAVSRRVLGLAGVFGAVATLLMLNGYFLIFPLPF